jgi:hypothetical protein
LIKIIIKIKFTFFLIITIYFSDDQILDDYRTFNVIDIYDDDNSETESGTSEEDDGFEEFEITAEKENKIWDGND